MTYFPSLSRQNWPHDPQELDGFYGNPRGITGANPAWEAENLTTFTFPWHEKGAQTYRIHKKVKDSLMRVLNAIWDYCGHDQARITAGHIDETGGTYNYRVNRNNSSVLSNHARGIAIDLAPDENPNRAAWREDGTHLPRFVIEAFKQEGWRWGGDFQTTKDGMHFEAVFDMHHDQAPVPAPKPTDTPAPAPPTSLPPSPVPTPWPVPALPTLADGLEALVRMLILRRTGLPQELEHLKATTLPALTAARAQIDAAITALTAFSIQDTPIIPGAPPVTPAPAPPAPSKPVPAPPTHGTTQQDIHATCFGGSLDPNRSAYDNHLITDDELGFSLPGTYHGDATIELPATGKTVTAKAVDKGPWNTRDNYWDNGTRPLAESQFKNGTRAQNGRVPTNPAGIDLTPGTVIALGGATSVRAASTWSGVVNWHPTSSTGDSKMSTQTTPEQVTVATQPATDSKINWTAGVKGLASAILLANAIFGFHLLPLSDATQVILVTLLNTVGDPAIMVMRTYFTTKITAQSAAKV